MEAMQPPRKRSQRRRNCKPHVARESSFWSRSSCLVEGRRAKTPAGSLNFQHLELNQQSSTRIWQSNPRPIITTRPPTSSSTSNPMNNGSLVVRSVVYSLQILPTLADYFNSPVHLLQLTHSQNNRTSFTTTHHGLEFLRLNLITAIAGLPFGIFPKDTPARVNFIRIKPHFFTLPHLIKFIICPPSLLIGHRHNDIDSRGPSSSILFLPAQYLPNKETATVS